MVLDVVQRSVSNSIAAGFLRTSFRPRTEFVSHAVVWLAHLFSSDFTQVLAEVLHYTFDSS